MPYQIARMLLLIFGGIFAGVLGAFHSWLYLHMRGPFPRDSFGEMAMIFTGATTFITVLYFIGMRGLRFLGYSAASAAIARRKKVHEVILGSMSVLLLATAWLLDP